MTDETTYFLENAKSARAACKKCKVKIAKEELRIGVSALDNRTGYHSTSFYHPQCFTIGRNLKQDGVTATSFVENLLQDNSDDKCLKDEDYKHNLIAGLEGGGNKKRASMDADTDDKKKKKSRIEDLSPEESQVYELYSAMKVDELKDVLRNNSQAGLAGTKEELLRRCVDGHSHGRIDLCPSCGEGKLKLLSNGTVSCSGFYDEATQVRQPCFFSCPAKDAPRLLPWRTTKPTEEEKEQDSKKKKTDGTSDDDAWRTTLLPLLEHIHWDLSSAVNIKTVNSEVAQACQKFGRLNLPSDESTAKIEIGRIILSNKDKSREEICKLIVDNFGLKLTEKDIEAKQHAMSSLCACPANGALYEIMLEFGKVYMEEGNKNAGATYKKVANAIKDIEYEITEENAKGLCSKKTKVDGIGKGSADKIYEFLTTGTIAKLEEKRMK